MGVVENHSFFWQPCSSNAFFYHNNAIILSHCSGCANKKKINSARQWNYLEKSLQCAVPRSFGKLACVKPNLGCVFPRTRLTS